MIFIPSNVPSSKNSRQWTGRYFVTSKNTQRYVKETAPYWLQYRSEFIRATQRCSKPYLISLYFIRDSKRKFDLINACQIIQDLMVKHKWLDDDNADEIVPIFLGYHVDKAKAGVVIAPYTRKTLTTLKNSVMNNM